MEEHQQVTPAQGTAAVLRTVRTLGSTMQEDLLPLPDRRGGDR